MEIYDDEYKDISHKIYPKNSIASEFITSGFRKICYDRGTILYVKKEYNEIEIICRIAGNIGTNRKHGYFIIDIYNKNITNPFKYFKDNALRIFKEVGLNLDKNDRRSYVFNVLEEFDNPIQINNFDVILKLRDKKLTFNTNEYSYVAKFCANILREENRLEITQHKTDSGYINHIYLENGEYLINVSNDYGMGIKANNEAKEIIESYIHDEKKQEFENLKSKNINQKEADGGFLKGFFNWFRKPQEKTDSAEEKEKWPNGFPIDEINKKIGDNLQYNDDNLINIILNDKDIKQKLEQCKSSLNNEELKKLKKKKIKYGSKSIPVSKLFKPDTTKSSSDIETKITKEVTIIMILIAIGLIGYGIYQYSTPTPISTTNNTNSTQNSTTSNKTAPTFANTISSNKSGTLSNKTQNNSQSLNYIYTFIAYIILVIIPTYLLFKKFYK